MRYYVTVSGGDDVIWLPQGAGESISQAAIANLRRMRISHGFDYQGIGVRGTAINRIGTLSVEGVERRIRASTDARAPAVPSVRLIVSQRPVEDDGTKTDFGLLIGIHEGSEFRWEPGTRNYAGIVTIDEQDRPVKVASVVQDVFQDVMLGNCSSIQAVLAKFGRAGGTDRHVYERKSEFARRSVAGGTRHGMLAGFAPDRYASFSAIARADGYRTMDEREISTLARLWSGFMVAELADHFLDVQEATDLVTTGYFHRSRPERVAGSGPRPKSRGRREDLSVDEVAGVLDDPQIVTTAGRYVLCVRNNDRSIDETGPIFGWRNEKRKSARRLKLCTEHSYSQMVEHVRRGSVTPIHLFLRAQGKGARG